MLEHATGHGGPLNNVTSVEFIKFHPGLPLLNAFFQHFTSLQRMVFFNTSVVGSSYAAWILGAILRHDSLKRLDLVKFWTDHRRNDRVKVYHAGHYNCFNYIVIMMGLIILF